MKAAIIPLAVGIVCASTAFAHTVTYTVTSTQPGRPTLVRYEHHGEDVYDSLNWGNRDGDTMPWSLTLADDGTPYLRVTDSALGRPWPTLTCSITVGGVTTSHTADGYCEVRS